MRLYRSPTSPFARTVEVTIHELGLGSAVERVTGSGTPLDPGQAPVTANPLGKVPCLTREDGPALHDSRVICRYLDAVGGGKLYPAAPRLWETLTLEATAHGMMEAMLLMVYEGRLRPEGMHFAPWVEGQWLKVSRSLDAIEGRWIAYLAGPVDAAQVAVGCALGYADFRHGARNWREGRPALAAWAGRFAARPSMEATKPT